MRTAWASSLKPLGACLLAVMLCAGLALPAHALTSNTRFTSAVAVTKETAYTGIFEAGAEAHTGLFVADNPVNAIDPDGRKTVITVINPNDHGAGDQTAADKAASHLQKAGWTVINRNTGDFSDIKFQFDGVIFSGHGDAGEATDISISELEGKLRGTGSKLDVGISLSCHGFDFISKVSRDGYTTPTALIIGYWGYAANTWTKSYRIGHAIDKWVANPTYTSLSYGNLLTDGFGTVGVPIANKAIEVWDSASIPAGGVFDMSPVY